jgi:hypothetical protein
MIAQGWHQAGAWNMKGRLCDERLNWRRLLNPRQTAQTVA